MASKCGILIVDDNFELCKSLAEILEEEGYSVCTVDSGERAIEVGSSGEFDVAFVDIKLPGIDGFEVLRELRKKTPRTVFIMITAFANDETYSKLTKEGDFEVMQKPFNMDEFMKRVRTICSTRKKRSAWNIFGRSK